MVESPPVRNDEHSGASPTLYAEQFEHLPVMVWALDPDGRCLWMNFARRAFTGAASAASLSHGWVSEVHGDDITAMRAALRETGNGRTEFEYRLRSASGDYRWMLDTFTRELEISGVPGAVLGVTVDIHERRLREDAAREEAGAAIQQRDQLAATVAHIQVVTDTLPALVVYVDAAERYTFLNSPSLEWMGAPPDAFVGKTVREAIGEDAYRGLKHGVRGALAGDAQRFEGDVPRANGLRSVTMEFIPDVAPDGSVRGFVGLLQDLTDQRRAERRAASILATLSEAFFSLDSELRVTYANDAAGSLAGCAVPEMLGRPVTEVLGGEGGVALAAMAARTVASGEDGREEQYLPGAGAWWEIRTVPTTLGIDVYVADVTPRALARVALEESEQNLRALADTIPALVFRTGPKGGMNYCNRAWVEYTGVDAGVTGGASTAAWAPLVHPDDNADSARLWRHSLETGEPYETEYRLRRRDGAYRWHVVRAAPVRSAEGSILGWYGTCTDIEELRQAQSQLEAVAEELRRASSVKDEVLGLVSHELRTPLTTLKGNASLLKRHADTLDPADRLQAFRDIEADAERLQQIIENMLLLARIQGTGGAELEPILLGRLLRTSVDEHRERYPTPPVRLAVEDDSTLVRGHDGYLRQVIANLLSNAAKYGEGTPIVVTLATADGLAVLSVADRGKGIAAEAVEQVFAPFFRSASHSERAPGLGLGLTVCKRLVDEMGGTIEVEPRPGGGAVFVVRVPLLTEEDESEN